MSFDSRMNAFKESLDTMTPDKNDVEDIVMVFASANLLNKGQKNITCDTVVQNIKHISEETDNPYAATAKLIVNALDCSKKFSNPCTLEGPSHRYGHPSFVTEATKAQLKQDQNCMNFRRNFNSAVQAYNDIIGSKKRTLKVA